MKEKVIWIAGAICVVILFAVLATSFPKMFSGVTSIGKFSTYGTETEVYDVKAGNRACLIIITKMPNDPDPRFFFSCPQDR